MFTGLADALPTVQQVEAGLSASPLDDERP